MRNLGLIVEGDNNWSYINEIADALSARYSIDIFSPSRINTPIFKERINRFVTSNKLKKILKKNDVVFFEWVGPYLAEVSQHKNSNPIITRLHSYELYEWSPAINWDNVSTVILTSKAMQDKFIKLYPNMEERTALIYHGVDLSKFDAPERKVYKGRIGMLGRVTPIKRCYELVLSLYEARKQGLDLYLDFAGPPGIGADYRYTVAIQSLIKKLELTEYVKLEGFVQSASTWYHDIDIFISNSYWEGAQVALMEAMASGCYCLSHFWDGADELLPVDNLYLTQNQLIKELGGYHNKCESERKVCQQQMRQLACQKFDIARVIDELDSLISKAADIKTRESVT